MTELNAFIKGDYSIPEDAANGEYTSDEEYNVPVDENDTMGTQVEPPTTA